MPAGRPRSFDASEALDRAMELFWERGYEGTSLADLTEAMGINRPSLYAAFGNKESLFRQALVRYVTGPGGHLQQALDAPTSREVVERIWFGSSAMVSQPERPRGCLLVQGVLACGSAAEPLRLEVARLRAAGETLIEKRLKRAVAEGDLPPDANPADLARLVATVNYGLAIQAASGVPAKALRRVAQLALAAWPTAK
jgi:AcrR family transcriptional regulator